MDYSKDWREKTLDLVVHTPIADDPRTTCCTFLGWPKDRIFEDVIEGGQADFDAVLDKLTGNDKALLYAKYNQPGHLTELDLAFKQLLGQAPGLYQPYIFDIGCGPFTAGLSLAKVLGNRRIFHYYGVDLYSSMRTLASSLVQTARALGAFDAATTTDFFQDLRDIPTPHAARNNVKIFIASYLLSSNTLNVHTLVRDIASTSHAFGFGPSFVLYTNSTTTKAQRNYPDFKATLEKNNFECLLENQSWIDHNRKKRSVFYALFKKLETAKD